MTTTKKELVEQVSECLDMKKEDVFPIIDQAFVTMRESLIHGDRIEIRGFGVFEVKDTKARTSARNPRTSALVYVPPGKKTRFKPGKVLKEALRKPLDD
ncbi:MAG TPA: integration host factor subunit beta [candidate division Zixibacteria bacterium]|jgi:nucleoid DNA-binding protein|nr:HU family DNA-binding protein [Candidatus Latescibacterota bacterium]HIG48838.1 integration host factor subunit beta [candidate division Zixibacteria bacterium]|tara:strand:- start:40 stop:336 length:297 start_codon:yes stop_codon:yes gene_type:complete